MPQTGVHDTVAAMTALFFAAAMVIFLLLAQAIRKNEVSVQNGRTVIRRERISLKQRDKSFGKMTAAGLHHKIKKQE